MTRAASRLGLCSPLWAALLAAGCANTDIAPEPPALRPDEARALIVRALPANTPDAPGWATDIYAAFATLRIAPTPPNICSVASIAEQESGFRADPAVPGMGAIAWKEIDARAKKAGVPTLIVHTALRVPSGNGKSYSERIDAAKTERDLSDIFEDFIGRVPMGNAWFSGWNPVHTAGPMQVSVDFAQKHAASKPYPYPLAGSIRREVFTRRGGMYFGIAHLLDYPVAYDKPLYRFADFNAGHYASRNAAVQNAISLVSGVPLVADGDLVRRDGGDRQTGNTETAAVSLAKRLGMSESAIRSDLDQDEKPDLERTTFYQRLFALADKVDGRPQPRAALPQIELHSPKITRKLTTAWFAERVDERYRRCLARIAS